MTTTFTLYWVREDRQGDYEMGTYDSKSAAEAAIPAMEAVLIDQCGYDYQKDEIRAGSWHISETTEDDE